MDKRAQKQAMAFVEAMDLGYDDYKEVVAGLLTRVDPYKGLGTPLYMAVCGHSWNVYLESVALRRTSRIGVVEVFMTKRDESDPDWQGYWHVPGTALRYGDTEESAWARLAREYGVPILSRTHVGDAGIGWFKKGDTGRGPGISLIHVTKLEGEPMLNERRGWFNVNDLPDPTVPLHINPIIPRAVSAYQSPDRRGY